MSGFRFEMEKMRGFCVTLGTTFMLKKDIFERQKILQRGKMIIILKRLISKLFRNIFINRKRYSVLIF